jgi:tetratricopeptide (TPR) repeat protein
MDLQRKIYLNFTTAPILRISASVALFLLFLGVSFAAQRPPALIRDTGVADAAETAPEVKGPDPILCEKNISIGDYYYKQKNYVAAIRRYLDALEFQADSARAYDALARAYQKNGQPAKAIAAYKQFIEKNPDSPSIAEFRARLAKLEKNAK